MTERGDSLILSLPLPSGFRSFVTNVGIKDDTDDFTVVTAEGHVSAAGVFTQSRFAGPSVLLSREHLAVGSPRAVVVISKNANVATGEAGVAHAREVTELVASRIGIATHDVLIASTGVIGRTYPIELRYRPVGVGDSGVSDGDADHAADPDDETAADDYIDGIVREAGDRKELHW